MAPQYERLSRVTLVEHECMTLKRYLSVHTYLSGIPRVEFRGSGDMMLVCYGLVGSTVAKMKFSVR